MYRRMYSIYEKISGRDVLSKLDELESNQWLSSSELEEIQNKKLKNIIDLAIRNIPYYKNLQRKYDIDVNNNNSKEIIEKFPPLTKEKLIQNFKNLKNPNYSGKTYRNFSGGSTGMPVKILQDQIRNDYNSAATKRSDQWAGLKFDASVFQFWGAQQDLGTNIKEIINRVFRNRYMFNAFDWSEKKIFDIYELMNENKPDIILSYSSSLFHYVNVMIANNLNSEYVPKGIITSADMLYDYQRDIIEKYFGTEVYNRYGSREVGLIASECEHHNGLHISTERLFLEVVDDNYKPVPIGEIGKILITDLTNSAMPLLRYEIGDMGKLAKNQECSCGRGLLKLESLEGRVSDYLINQNGNYVSGAALSTLVPKMDNIKNIQIIQKKEDTIKLKVVVTDSYSTKINEKNIKRLLSEYLGKDMKYELAYVEDLKNKKSGKYRFVINEIK